MGTSTAPDLADLWDNRAEFRSEDPAYCTMSVNLNGPTGHSGAGKLSIARMNDGRFIGIYRGGHAPKDIRMAISSDGITFDDSRVIARESGWGKGVGDPSVVVFTIQGVEHLFVFYEADALHCLPPNGTGIIVNTGMMWSTDQGASWKQHAVPLTDSKDIPTWGHKRFRGTSVPSAMMHVNQTHLWVFWTGLYGINPNHSDVGAGYIGIVRPGTTTTLPLSSGGTLEQHDDGNFKLTIDSPQQANPVLERGQYDWCQGAVDIGNVTLGRDGQYYAVFVAGRRSEGEEDDVFSCGLARTRGITSFEKKSTPILVHNGHGRHDGLQYPMLLAINGIWYLYYVIAKGLFDSTPQSSKVPNPNECHARLALQWK